MNFDPAADSRDLEIARLRSGMNDLMALLALSSAWTGREASDIARMLGEALAAMLQLDFVLVEVVGEEPKSSPHFVLDGSGLREGLDHLLGADVHAWPTSARFELLGRDFSLICDPIGLRHEFGIVAALATRPDFPNDAERLLLNVARNQMLVALQEAKLRREERLRASEMSAIALIEGIPGFVAVLSPDGGVLRVNRQIIDYCGQTLEELRNWGTNGTVHPDDLPHVAEVFGGAIAAGIPYVIEQRLRRHDGEYRWFDNRGRPVHDEGGQITAWHVLLTDIDDRKRAEDAVRTREMDLRRQSETFPQMLWSATPDGNIDYCNERLLEFSGLDAETVRNDGWVNLLHPDDREPTARVWMHCIATGEPYSVEVRQFRVADRTYRWVLTMALPLRDEEGRIVKWYGSCVDIHDRKLAEEALKASERHLTQIIDTIPAYVWSARPDGAVDFYNRGYLDYLGVPPEEIQGWDWASVIHPDDVEDLTRVWTNALSTGEPYETQMRVRRFDGTYRWCLSRTSILRGPDGTAKWFGVSIDIHEMKMAQERLRESELNLRLLTETIPQNLFSASVSGSVNYLNSRMREWFGRADETIMAEEWVHLAHPDDRDDTVAAWIGTVTAGLPYRREVRFLHHSGEYRWCDNQARPLRDEDGTIIAWHGVVNDIHDRKLAEEELKARERKLREAHDHLAQAQRLSQTGSFTTDVNADVHVWSDELYRILEYDRDEAPTFSAFRDRIHADDRAGFDSGFKRALRDRVEFDEIFRIVTPRGNTKYLHAVAHFLPGETDRPIVIGSIQDITESRRVEETLDRARSELAHVTRAMSLGTLTASIAHEVSQPLSGIITNAGTCLRLLGSSPPDVEGAIKTAQRTLRDGNRASEVLTRLRTLYRRKEFVAEAIDLNDAAREVITLSAQDLQRRRVTILTDFDDDLSQVSGDRVQLQQVILNLVLNAADALETIERGPRQIFVETADAGAGQARLTVRDTGPGIDADALGRIFDAFYTTKPDGMGIGLSVSKSIMERLNGSLQADANDGPGATFSLSLPYAPGAAGVRAGRPVQAEVHSAEAVWRGSSSPST